MFASPGHRGQVTRAAAGHGKPSHLLTRHGIDCGACVQSSRELWRKGRLLLQSCLYYICARKDDACLSTCPTGWAVLWYALRHDTSRLPR